MWVRAHCGVGIILRIWACAPNRNCILESSRVQEAEIRNMQECNSNQVLATSSKTERAEVMAAVAGLAEEVAHLAHQVKRLVAIADARRKRSALQRRARREMVQQAELKAVSTAPTCDVHVVETAEATKFPLSPQQYRCTENAVEGGTALIDSLTVQLEAAFPQSHHANCQEENAIAARVADLGDRLGGFVKSSLQSA